MKKTEATLVSLLLLLAIIGCNKSEQSLDEKKNNTNQIKDSAIAVLLDTREYDNNNELMVTYTAYNMNGTVKWKRPSLGTGSGPLIRFGNGLLFVATSYFNFLPNGGFESYNNLYAIDANTGVSKWENLKSGISIINMTASNDTLYTSYNFGGNSYWLGAINALTGAVLWQQKIAFPYPANNLIAQGSMLYFLTSTSTTVNNVIAFDLNTRSIKWNTPISINIGETYSRLELTDNQIFLKNGLGELLALNKGNGQVLWKKSDRGYGLPLFVNNLVYASVGSGISALDAASGTQRWLWSGGDIPRGSYPFVSADRIFVSAITDKFFLTSLDASTGTPVWKKDSKYFLQYPMASGTKLFVLKSNTMNDVPKSEIVVYDAATGIAKDSFTVNGLEFERPSLLTASGKWIQPN